MQIELTDQHSSDKSDFKRFADKEIAPYADRFDQEQRIPIELIEKLAQSGYLAAILPEEYGGRDMDIVKYGLLTEEIGRGCASVRSLLTVHDMVAWTLLKWGSKKQKEYWLPKLASGAAIAALGLTEPDVGSDAKAVKTAAALSGDSCVLNGTKRWVSFGQIADVFLIFAQSDGKPAAFLVERERQGLAVVPITGLLGTKASMLGELHLNECRIPKDNVVGAIGFGFSHVASTALDHGRYSVAWGCVGIAQACLDSCLQYASERKQFGNHLRDYQLISRMITDMIVNVKAARLLCYQAGYLKSKGDPDAMMETMIAKYFASTMLSKVASDAVQIHGANGCSSDYSVQRHFRDAKVMEIIEGTTQIHQINIARYAYQGYPSISHAGREK